MTSPTLRRLAAAATLTHFLPGASCLLAWPAGEERRVGAHPSCDLSPCRWREAVVHCAAAASALPHELLLGIPGLPSVTFEAGPDQQDMGGGVIRAWPGGRTVDVFTTTLDRLRVHDAIEACDAPGRARIGIRRDEHTGVSLIAVAHLMEPEPDGARLAWALAMSCAVGEVCFTSA